MPIHKIIIDISDSFIDNLSNIINEAKTILTSEKFHAQRIKMLRKLDAAFYKIIEEQERQWKIKAEPFLSKEFEVKSSKAYVDNTKISSDFTIHFDEKSHKTIKLYEKIREKFIYKS